MTATPVLTSAATGPARPRATRDEHQRDVATATAAAAAYNNSADLLMADADYDALIDQIAVTEQAHPDWADSGGLLTAVAGGTSPGGDITHTTPMLSLGKAKEHSDVLAFTATVTGDVVVEPKLDGLAVNATYKNGNLLTVALRGDSRTGEDVTARCTGVRGLPVRLATRWTGEVRGEVYLTDSDFEQASSNRVAAGKTPFANPRNAAAGTIRNATLDYEVNLSFAAYDIVGTDATRHTDAMRAAARLGFGTALSLAPATATPVTSDPATVIDTLDRIEQARPALGFPIDGAVVKADLLSERSRLGAGTKDPRWAVAFKYPPQEATSELVEVIREVGRTGVVSLTARYLPVPVGGIVARRATLHNAKFVRGLGPGFGIGCGVWVHRAGDVIPRLDAVVEGRPAPVTYVVPTDCPQCGEPLDTTSSELWRCLTPSCSVTGRIEYAGQRDVWDIDGLDTASATALVEADLVKDVADLFDLTVEQVAAVRIGTTSTGLPRLIGPVIGARIIAGIDAARRQPLHRTIAALGIRMTGTTVGRWLADHFETMDALRAATVDELAAIDGLGPKKAPAIRAGLDEMSGVLDRLAAAGLPMQVDRHEVVAVGADGTVNTIAGRKVAVTGAVPGYGRDEATDLVARLGGKPTSSVSRNTDLVVVGEGAGSKAQKAADLGVEIMAAGDFAALARALGF